MSSPGGFDMAVLPSALQYHQAARKPQYFVTAAAQHSFPEFITAPKSPAISLVDTEKEAIRRALDTTHGERGKAAQLLGIGRTTLFRKMKEYGIE